MMKIIKKGEIKVNRKKRKKNKDENHKERKNK